MVKIGFNYGNLAFDQYRSLEGTEFKDFRFRDYQGKYLVLFFYPLDFTFVCPTEITEFNDRVGEFEENNCSVVGCSTDSLFSHLAFNKQDRKAGGLGGCTIPLISDFNKDLAREFDVLVDEGENAGVTYRGLFIFDHEGNLRHQSINDLPVGRNVSEVLRLVQAFQYTDEYGEVCPIGWTPGAATMKPDPEGSQEYFKSTNKD